ncbi:MAG: hypothetical protein LBM78_02725 [Clostridiales bacterium]|jgi:hypothetical protein|nr:hypothetical protein [Clostridiales bacterium]
MTGTHKNSIAALLTRVHDRLRKSALFTLVVMQLRERYKINLFKNAKRSLFSLIFTVFGIAVVTVAAYLVYWVLGRFRILSVAGAVPPSAVAVIVTVMLLLSVLAVTLGLTKALYFFPDNFILLSYPVQPSRVFLSKLLVFYVGELRRNIYLLLPVLLAYGIFARLPWPFYFLLLFAYFSYSALTVLIGSLLSVPALYIAAWLRGQQYVQVGLTVVLATALVYGVFSVAALIPSNFNLISQIALYTSKINSTISLFNRIFWPFSQLSFMVTGAPTSVVGANPYTWKTVFILVGTVLSAGLLLAVVFLAQQKLFFAMASKPSEYKRKTGARAKNRVSPAVLSELRKDLMSSFRSPAAFFGNYMMVFTLPFAVFLLNKVYASISTRLLGDQMIMSFNVLIILLISLAQNVPLASALSKEGKAANLVKSRPSNVWGLIASKLIINATLTVVSLAITAVIMRVAARFSAPDAACLFFIVLLVSLGHMLWSIESDITKPQYTHYYGGEHESIDPNELKSALFAFLLAFLFAGAAMFFFVQEYGGMWWRVVLIAAAFLAARLALLIARTRVYFRAY